MNLEKSKCILSEEGIKLAWEELTQSDIDILTDNWWTSISKNITQKVDEAMNVVDLKPDQKAILPDTLEWAQAMADELDWRNWDNWKKIKLETDLNPYLQAHLEEHKQERLKKNTDTSTWEILSPEVVDFLESQMTNLTPDE